MDQIVARIVSLESARRLSGAGMGAAGATREPEWTEAFEQTHDRWRDNVAALQKRLLDDDPNAATSRDLITWSRWGDLTKAKAALDRANDLAALKRLAEGEVQFYLATKR